MKIKYDVYEMPSADNSEQVRLHARIINKGIVTTDKLAKEIEYSTSLTEGDVLSVISSLSYKIVEKLMEGNRIHLEGLGYFQLSITSLPLENGQKMRAEHVKVRSINFRPEKKIKNILSNASFERVKYNMHSFKHSQQEIVEVLLHYLEEHQYITRAEFQTLCNLTKGKALQLLNGLIKEGMLAKEGVKGSPIYKLKEERQE